MSNPWDQDFRIIKMLFPRWRIDGSPRLQYGCWCFGVSRRARPPERKRVYATMTVAEGNLIIEYQHWREAPVVLELADPESVDKALLI